MARIVDVAAAAGVSPTTVSHVLNNRGRIADETRDKVLAAARDLGYQANAHAQQLVTRRSRIIAIQMPDLGLSARPSLPHSAYFLELINGAAAAADNLRYALVISPSGSRASILNGFAIDGAIIVDPQDGDPTLPSGIPVVTVGTAEHDDAAVLTVDNDHAGAASVALDHFAEHGRHRPALLTDTTRRSYVNDVLTGYRDWVRRHGAQDCVLAVDDLDASAMDAVVNRLIAAGADAVYASSDDLVLALLDAVSRAGLQVPKNLAVASAVDSRVLTLTSPAISGTNLFPFRTGQMAAELLIDSLDNGPEATSARLIPTEFIARASSLPS